MSGEKVVTTVVKPIEEPWFGRRLVVRKYGRLLGISAEHHDPGDSADLWKSDAYGAVHYVPIAKLEDFVAALRAAAVEDGDE